MGACTSVDQNLFVSVFIFFHELCCRYKDVYIGSPSVALDGVTEKLTPHNCRLSDMT